MKLTDFTPQIAVSPSAVGVGGEEPRGGALQPLTSPSPSAPEVGHRFTTRARWGHTAAVERLLAAGAAVDAVSNAGQGPPETAGWGGGGVEG